ncbi:MAG: hypothetical protein K0Q89_53 [Thermomicrobiales bacterium]|jgi:hypothetical protein|nr:hypothetical protein [Thermomicrobiales bacterium]
MHVANTERIITQILRQPERFEMASFVDPGYDSESLHLDVCGTACCIAGWAVVNDLSDRLGHDKAVMKVAVDAERADTNPMYRISDRGATLLELPDLIGDWASGDALPVAVVEALHRVLAMPPLFFRPDWPVHYQELAELYGNIFDSDRYGEAIAGAVLLRDMLDRRVHLDENEHRDAESDTDGYATIPRWWRQFTPEGS